MAKTARTGYFVALEGAKADYTSAVLKLLAEQLRDVGYQPLVLSFPRLDQAPGFYAREYDSGKFGNPLLVNPYAATLYFALDYHQAATKINDYLAVGGVVLVSGWQAANMARQGIKFDRQEERFGYYTWCDNLAEQVLGLPRPDLSIVLQTDIDHDTPIIPHPGLETAYRDIQQLFPKDIHGVDLVRGGQLLDSSAAAEQVKKMISSELPEPRPILFDNEEEADSTLIEIPLDRPKPATENNQPTILVAAGSRASEVFLPELDGELLDEYQSVIEQILKLSNRIERKLAASKDESIIAKLPQISQLTRPVATMPGLARPLVAVSDPEAAKIIDLQLSNGHGKDDTTWRLTSFSPGNELELLPDWLFEHSNLSATELRGLTDKLSFDDKELLLAKLLNGRRQAGAPLGLRYAWEGMISLATLAELSRHFKPNCLSWQALSPRHGYAMPAAIEAGGVEDEFLQCFDLSLELYSDLQAADKHHAAQYAVLLGHRARVSLHASDKTLVKLAAIAANPLNRPSLRRGVKQMLELANEKHPITVAELRKERGGQTQAR